MMLKSFRSMTILLTAVIWLAVISPGIHADSTHITERLVAEFDGAYPQQSTPTGRIETVRLVAAPGQWRLMPSYQTPVWAYNGQVPGPVIRLKLGDTLRVKLINNLPEPTTIHWHGVRVPNAMDGVPGVNQEPVPPGDRFTYEFTPKDPGTFWFHPHLNSAEQVERGLHGVLVVEDPNEPRYSQDLVWVMDDWRLTQDARIDPKFVTRHDLAHDGRWGNYLTVNGTYQPAVIVKPGERIRLRLVNVANGRVFVPVFEQLTPLVIAVDGMLVGEVLPLRHFDLAAGNRLDLDITIPKTFAGKKLALQDAFSRRRTHTLAYLQVADQEPVVTPDFEAPYAHQFPQWLDAVDVPVTHEYRLNGRRGGPYGITWTIDGKAWPEADRQPFKAGQFVRLRFNNQSPRLHPMHIHGQFFKVITRNGQPVNENLWRDTVLVGPRQALDIGMIPFDYGVWVNHCHILEHAEAGMMTSIAVK